eukprot:5051639-Alexandrium_andersonii.AAC.1
MCIRDRTGAHVRRGPHDHHPAPPCGPTGQLFTAGSRACICTSGVVATRGSYAKAETCRCRGCGVMDAGHNSSEPIMQHPQVCKAARKSCASRPPRRHPRHRLLIRRARMAPSSHAWSSIAFQDLPLPETDAL